MLRHTFIHIPGIGEKTERALWSHNILDWTDLSRLLAGYCPLPVGLEKRIGQQLQRHKGQMEEFLRASEEALHRRDIAFFLHHLAGRELWRVYPEFKDRCAFLDIETTGQSIHYSEITLIGLYDGSNYRAFIRDHNLEEFEREISRFSLLVTFNGTLFDLPFLRAKYPRARLPLAHLDLRYLLQRLGYRGGLKQIEGHCGIRRREEVIHLSGRQAPLLWNRYCMGDTGALELLIKYNREDTVNLKELLDFAYQRLAENTLPNPKTGPSSVVPHQATRGARSPDPPQPSYPLLARKSPPKMEDLLEMLARQGYRDYPLAIGIDLAASEERPTGWAALLGDRVMTRRLHTDSEIIQTTVQLRPTLISIDSPLSLPRGTTQSGGGRIARECELYLKRRGISVFWCLLPSMQRLTHRGIRLARLFREQGFEVIESFPGGAQDILNIPRKKNGLAALREGLIAFGLRGDFREKRVSHDELDAITSALVGYFYLGGHYEAIGNPEEDYLILPKPLDVGSRMA